MWYDSEEKAQKACSWKEKKFNESFVVIKDSEKEDCWWAQRKSSLKNFWCDILEV